ncbi:carboxypeptidase regulatory-like domain-containing protein [Pedobacter sp.]|uniref:carboxypeptidase-like regulatory domain-containing protein n=1 Tax=Pedobacter sp. TaxID=1411316 RepID=UPI003C5B9E45
MKIFYYTLLLIFISCVFPSLASAQGSQALINGVITEESGKPVLGASISIRNEATGFSTSTASNSKGEYTFNQLPLGGPYSINVSFTGFGSRKKTGFMLNLGDVQKINIQIESTSTVLQTVQITSSGLKASIPTLGASTSISARNIAKLPVNGRNFTSLIDLSPLSRGGSISGQLATSTNYSIDGMTAKNPTFGGTATPGAPYSISIEAVREFKVVTNQYDVTYGRSGGGAITTATKSGTNELSGSAFTFAQSRLVIFSL